MSILLSLFHRRRFILLPPGVTWTLCVCWRLRVNPNL